MGPSSTSSNQEGGFGKAPDVRTMSKVKAVLTTAPPNFAVWLTGKWAENKA